MKPRQRTVKNKTLHMFLWKSSVELSFSRYRYSVRTTIWSLKYVFQSLMFGRCFLFSGHDLFFHLCSFEWISLQICKRLFIQQYIYHMSFSSVQIKRFKHNHWLMFSLVFESAIHKLYFGRGNSVSESNSVAKIVKPIFLLFSKVAWLVQESVFAWITRSN